MTDLRAGPPPPVARSSAVAAVGLALAVAVGLALFGAAGAAVPQTAPSWPPSHLAWNNGLVLCTFDPMRPSVAVSALDLNGSGLSSGITEVTEVNSAATPVAVASMVGATWAVVNASTSDTFDLAYRAHVALVAAGGAPIPSGSTDVRVDYVLPAYADSAPDNLSSVAAVFQVSNWSWQSPGDHLVITLPIWPTFAYAEHLTSPTPSGAGVTSSSYATGAAREYFQLSDRATALTSNGSTESVGVSPVVAVSPSLASVQLVVGSSSGNITSLTYTAHVSLPLPATLAGLPLYDYALVGSAAAAVSIAVAAGTRRVRQRPSDLEFVDEEP
jgi:hypothetical protein